MRAFLLFVVSALGSIAFQASVALYPQTLQHYAWLVRWLWIAWAAGLFIWLVTHLNFVRSLLGRSQKEPFATASAPSPSVETHATISPTISPVIAPVFNYGPLASPSPPETPKHEVRLPVAVEFVPWEGQMEQIFLTITNRGVAQTFHAQCRIIERRNDPNPQHRMTLDLQWQGGSERRHLVPGQSGNLLIASAGKNKSRGMEWMRIEGAPGQHGPESQWPWPEKNRPEYDLEVTVLGDKSDQPQSEQFTLCAGSTSALEMFKMSARRMPLLEIGAPQDGAEVGHRQVVSGSASPTTSLVQVWMHASNDQWYCQGDAEVKDSSWGLNCWFNEPDRPEGTFNIIALAGSKCNCTESPRPMLPEASLKSNTVTVRRTH
jgi:hypothetical protein